MVTVQLAGGLGNQLFQVSTAYAVARNNNTKVLLSTHGWGAVTGNHPSEYKDTILKEFLWTDEELEWDITKEGSLPKKINGNVKLVGYWQDPRYFHKYKKELIDLYHLLQYAEADKLNDNIFPMYDDIVSLHVRRGDYVRLKHKHPPVTPEYIRTAINTLKESIRIGAIWLFSDDLEWCKENIEEEVVIAETGDDVTNLALMTLADHHIISNSTYSWWGAYLSGWEHGITIAPERWYGDGRQTELNKPFKIL